MVSILDCGQSRFLEIILTILSSNSEADIMREKSIRVLRNSFQPILASKSILPEHSNNKNFLRCEDVKELKTVMNFFVAYSGIILNRFDDSNPSSLFSSGARPDKANPEPVEEIRLLMMTLLSDILCYLKAFRSKNIYEESCFSCTNVLEAFTNICKILPLKYALLDPYPELKRECCLVLQQLCFLAPSSVILGHLDSLVRPLILPSQLNDAGLALAKSSLLQHRHAKTRIYAIETTDAILMSQLYFIDGQPMKAKNDASEDELIKYQEHLLRQCQVMQGILESKILPSWKQCVLDRSALVRKSLIKSVRNLSVGLAKLQFHENNMVAESILSPKLLQLLFGSLADDAEENRIISKKSIEEVFVVVHSLSPESQIGCCKINIFLSCDVLPYILPLDIEDALDWSAPQRLHSIRSIGAVFDAMLDFDGLATEMTESSEDWISRIPIDNLVFVLCSLIEDEECGIRNAAACCAKTLGKHPKLGTVIVFNLISRIQETTPAKVIDPKSLETNINNPSIRFSGSIPAVLSVLSSVLRFDECKQRWVDEILHDICVVLAGRRILENFSDCEVMWQLTSVCEAILDVTDNSSFVSTTLSGGDTVQSDTSIYFIRCCIQILGCPVSFGISKRGSDMIDILSRKNGENNNPLSLWEQNFRKVLSMLLFEDYEDNFGGNDSGSLKSKVPHIYWDVKSPQFSAFEALLLNCNGDSVAKNFDLLSPLFYRHLAAPIAGSSSKEDASVFVTSLSTKLSFMALLQSVISKMSFAQDQLKPFLNSLIEDIIVPNLVWQVGGPASALRKVTIASLFTLLRGRGVMEHLNLSSLSKLFPVVQTNLTDDDASIRHLACLCLTLLLNSLLVKLTEKDVDHLYPDLVKALDDSNENIRFAACDAIRALLKIIPRMNCRAEVFGYIVDQVMVHMDDPNHELQLKCLDLLTFALDFDMETVVKCAKNAKSSHRETKFCDKLLLRASQKLS